MPSSSRACSCILLKFSHSSRTAISIAYSCPVSGNIVGDNQVPDRTFCRRRSSICPCRALCILSVHCLRNLSLQPRERSVIDRVPINGILWADDICMAKVCGEEKSGGGNLNMRRTKAKRALFLFCPPISQFDERAAVWTIRTCVKETTLRCVARWITAAKQQRPKIKRQSQSYCRASTCISQDASPSLLNVRLSFSLDSFSY